MIDSDVLTVEGVGSTDVATSVVVGVITTEDCRVDDALVAIIVDVVETVVLEEIDVILE